MRSSATASVAGGQPKLSLTQPGRPKSTPLDRPTPAASKKAAGSATPQATRVDPRQVGRLDMAHGEARQTGNGGFDAVAVAAQDPEQRLAPVVAVAVGGLGCRQPENIDVRDDAAHGTAKPAAKRGIGNHRKSAAQAGDIPGFRRRHQRDAAPGRCRRRASPAADAAGARRASARSGFRRSRRSGRGACRKRRLRSVRPRPRPARPGCAGGRAAAGGCPASAPRSARQNPSPSGRRLTQRGGR
jgi:hypothetical protein